MTFAHQQTPGTFSYLTGTASLLHYAKAPFHHVPALCLLNTLTSISVCSNWKSSDWLWGGGFQTTCPLPRQHSYLRRLDIRQNPLFSFSWPKHPHQSMQYPPLVYFPSYFLLAEQKHDEHFQLWSPLWAKLLCNAKLKPCSWRNFTWTSLHCFS